MSGELVVMVVVLVVVVAYRICFVVEILSLQVFPIKSKKRKTSVHDATAPKHPLRSD